MYLLNSPGIEFSPAKIGLNANARLWILTHIIEGCMQLLNILEALCSQIAGTSLCVHSWRHLAGPPALCVHMLMPVDEVARGGVDTKRYAGCPGRCATPGHPAITEKVSARVLNATSL